MASRGSSPRRPVDARLLASLSILLDEPSVAEDFVVAGKFLRTVEHSSPMREHKRLNQQRAPLQRGVTENTRTVKLDRVTRILCKVMETNDNARVGCGHFKSHSRSSPDLCMEVRQAIKLGRLQGLETEGVEFACPTYTLLVRSYEPEASRPVPFGG